MVAFSRALRPPNIRKRASTSKFDWPGRRASCTRGISDNVQTPNTAPTRGDQPCTLTAENACSRFSPPESDPRPRRSRNHERCSHEPGDRLRVFVRWTARRLDPACRLRRQADHGGQHRIALRLLAAIYRAEQLFERFHDRGFTIVGVPSNDFGGQEPGGATEISATANKEYGVTFPLPPRSTSKVRAGIHSTNGRQYNGRARPRNGISINT